MPFVRASPRLFELSSSQRFLSDKGGKKFPNKMHIPEKNLVGRSGQEKASIKPGLLGLMFFSCQRLEQRTYAIEPCVIN
jgi:hypothetical protein